MEGGSGSDVFIFDGDIGQDIVIDFNAAEDSLQISSKIADGLDPHGLAESATVTLSGVLLDFGADNSILLDGVFDTAGLAQVIEIA